VLWAIYVTVLVTSVLLELQYTVESVVMAGSTILAAWAGSIWGNGAAMLVVPEIKMTRLLHLSHHTDVNATLIYTSANKVYQFTEFQKNSDVITMTNIIILYISTVNKHWFSSSVRQQFYLPDISTHDPCLPMPLTCIFLQSYSNILTIKHTVSS
jgi:hypothetical protein